MGVLHNGNVVRSLTREHSCCELSRQDRIVRGVVGCGANGSAVQKGQDGIRGQALCDRSQDIEGSECQLICILWKQLKQHHGMGRECRDFLKQFRAWRSDEVDLPDFVAIAKQCSALREQPVVVDSLTFVITATASVSGWRRSARLMISGTPRGDSTPVTPGHIFSGRGVLIDMKTMGTPETPCRGIARQTRATGSSRQ